ncbi:flagellar protein FlhE [Dissulfurispira sp.]|uniref:flagellar protein FlhE n=1 Tax=Dissulfurispira sp. TaxID=2817609 RepID=UPI002FDB2ECB
MRKRRRLLLVLAMVAILVAALPLIAFASSGAWSDAKVGPDAYSKGYWYCADFNPTGQYVPPNATITLVSWQWSVLNYRSDLLVYICDSYGCQNISSLGIGTTTYFNNRSANQTFGLCFGVPGSGSVVPPIYGQYDRVNVSWQAPAR